MQPKLILIKIRKKRCFIINSFYVVDLETSGLKGFPQDKILEIGITEINLETKELKTVMDTSIYYDLDDNPEIIDCWTLKNGNMDIIQIDNGIDLENAIYQTQKILENKTWTSYNTDFDYIRFLRHWKISPPQYCLMKKCKGLLRLSKSNIYIPDKYKFPKLQEAYDYFVRKPLIKSGQTHYAIDDSRMAAEIILQIQDMQYIQSYLNEYIENFIDLKYNLVFDYWKLNGEFYKNRMITPQEFNGILLKGFCHLRKEDRNFNVYRIRNLSYEK